MDEQIKQIAERLKGLRDALDLSVEEVAADCNFTVEEYQAIESGECDFSVSVLQRIARKYGITLDELMFGEEPKMKSYFLTSGFKGRKADPFIVTVEPKPENTPVYFNTHEGQEFNLVIEGRMLLNINGKELILNPGDSLYFDSSKPHGMLALDGKTVKFLAVVMQ